MLTDFQNFCTARKRMKFSIQNPYNTVHLTLGLLLHYGGTVYIHFRGLLSPNGILPGAKFTLYPSLAFSHIGSVTARHSSSGR